MGVNYALQRIFGLFTHAAHIRSVLKCSYLADCFGGSQPELLALFGDFVANTVYRLLLLISVRYLYFSTFVSLLKNIHICKKKSPKTLLLCADMRLRWRKVSGAETLNAKVTQ